jgi:hypothetical protein
VRDGSHRLADLLADSKSVQSLLAPQVERPGSSGLRSRTPIVVGLVLPGDTFDDPAWPGAEPDQTVPAARLARRVAAARWLAAEGIVLVPFDPPAP